MNDDTTVTTPPGAWDRFRRARWYWQTAGWLFLAPVVLVVFTLSKPKAERGRWWALVAVAAIAYVAIGVSGGSDTKKTSVAAEGTAAADGRSSTTEKAAPSTTTTAKATTTTVPKTTTTTVPKTTTTTPPSIRGTGKVTESRLGAFDVCKQFVTDRLKAPSGAKWRDPIGDQVSYVGDGKGPITVDASVDSENSFGAKIRSTYTCTVSNTGGDKWHLDGLDFRDGGGL